VADDTTQQSSTEETETDETVAPEVSGASTPEDIEAYWRNRISGSDKAHAAAEKVLRDQLAAAQGKTAQAAPTSDDATAYKELATRLQTELETEKAARVTDTRSLKYPAAAQALGDPSLRWTRPASPLSTRACVRTLGGPWTPITPVAW